MQLELGLADDRRMKTVQEFTPRHIEIACQRPQDTLETDGRGAITLLVRDRRPWNNAGFRRCVKPRRGCDGGGIHTGYFGYSLQRVLLHTPSECVETNSPLLHELVVVETLVDNDIEPTKTHRRISADAQRQPYVRKLRVFTAPGIEYD